MIIFGNTGIKVNLLYVLSFSNLVLCEKGGNMEDLWCKNRQDLGKRGEDVALEYLLQRGMKLLVRNWRSGHKELDLVMEEEEFIRIVEVRSRNYPAQIDPFESVDMAKRKKIMQAAKGFVAANRQRIKGKEVVFDVISILFNGELFKVEYIREAFAPTW